MPYPEGAPVSVSVLPSPCVSPSLANGDEDDSPWCQAEKNPYGEKCRLNWGRDADAREALNMMDSVRPVTLSPATHWPGFIPQTTTSNWIVFLPMNSPQQMNPPF